MATELLEARAVVPVHFEGWAHFTQDLAQIRAAFAGYAGLTERLFAAEPRRDRQRVIAQAGDGTPADDQLAVHQARELAGRGARHRLVKLKHQLAMTPSPAFAVGNSRGARACER